MLNFPTNPTGGVTERAKLERIAKFAIGVDSLVISDEIYSELNFIRNTPVLPLFRDARSNDFLTRIL